MAKEQKTTNLLVNILGQEVYNNLGEIKDDELWVIKETNSDEDNAIASKTYADVGRDAISIGSEEPTSGYTKIWIDTSDDGMEYVIPADTDLKNLSEDGKKRITEIVLPDYNSAQSIASIAGESWIANDYGYIYAFMGEASNVKIRRTDVNGELLINIHGVMFEGEAISDKVVVAKDETIFVESRDGDVELIFYPFKGVM